ncbi:MAG TPA: hypothetical protein VJ957_11335 [Longimicrobiales bacterium]|nr:hypothetical protein [Longimicrobiales bacterium]
MTRTPAFPLALAALPALLVCAPLRAQDGPGTEGALVFQLSSAPRAVALGDAYAALSGPLALFHNPAGLAGAPSSAVLAYQTLPAGASAGLAGVVFRLGPGRLGVGLQFLDYGSIDEVTPDPTGVLGVPTGATVSGGEAAASLAYGLGLGPLWLGAAARALRVDIADVSDATTAFDAGVAAHFLDRRFTVAGALQNLGGEVRAGRPAPLPLTARLGMAVRVQSTADRRGVLAFELTSRRSQLDGPAPVNAGVGVELAGRWKEAWLVVRGGYRQRVGSGDAGSGLAVGGGVRLGGWLLDYAYQPLGPLGATHHLGLTYSPGS